MTKQDSQRCCKTVGTVWQRHPCGKPGKAQDTSGRWYCGLHSPDTLAKRQAKQDAIVAEHLAALKARIQKRELEERMLASYPEALALLTRATAFPHSLLTDEIREFLSQAPKAGLTP